MAVSLARLPRYLVLEPVSTVRLEIELVEPSCEIDVELQNPEPGRSFVMLLGKQGGPHLQRMRLSGRARILFDPKSPGTYALMLANPQKEPLVLRLRARNLVRRTRRPAKAPGRGTKASRSPPRSRAASLSASGLTRAGAGSPAGRAGARRAARGSAEPETGA